jgi:RNA polymerase primary sigma factor
VPENGSDIRLPGVNDLVSQMLKAAARYPLLTPLQEVELGRAIRAWQDHEGGPDAAPPRVRRAGKAALDRFVVCNIRLAHHIAKRYAQRGVPLEDLMQASIVGMIEAYRKFKPELGYRSSSYAIWYARQACQQVIAVMGQTLRLPVHTCDALSKVARASRQFHEQHGRRPSSAELAAAAGMSAKQLLQLNELVARSRMTSLDATLRRVGAGPDAMTVMEATADHGELGLSEADECAIERLHRKDVADWLRQCLEGSPDLDDQQRFILRQLYLSDEPPNMVRLAYLLNMNRSTLLQVERDALATLRQQMAPDRTPVAA